MASGRSDTKSLEPSRLGRTTISPSGIPKASYRTLAKVTNIPTLAYSLGWVMAKPELIKEKDDLKFWCEIAVKFVKTFPVK